jgi:hypothetical protein
VTPRSSQHCAAFSRMARISSGSMVNRLDPTRYLTPQKSSSTTMSVGSLISSIIQFMTDGSPVIGG